MNTKWDPFNKSQLLTGLWKEEHFKLAHMDIFLSNVYIMLLHKNDYGL